MLGLRLTQLEDRSLMGVLQGLSGNIEAALLVHCLSLHLHKHPLCKVLMFSCVP